MLHKQVGRAAAAVALSLALVGCGGSGANDVPELAPVTGTVTMAGQPVAGAIVVFEPEQGALSTGITGPDGRFELAFSEEHKGAVLGKHTVRVSKMEGEAGDETIPIQYNQESQLTQVVAEGPNNFDIKLD